MASDLLQVQQLQMQNASQQRYIHGLQEDFDFNLELLDGRDRELQHQERQLHAVQSEKLALDEQMATLERKLVFSYQSG